MSVTKFFPREGHFERKYQSCPNALIFHRGLSDSGKLLILALNGIATGAPKWTIIQTDLQKRMGWGKDKMQATIKDCIKFGYLKVRQAKRQANGEKWRKGQFAPNEFEFDIEGSYLPQQERSDDKHLPSGDTEPKPCFPSTALPSPKSQPLTCSSYELTCLKEQTNKEEKDVVVVPPDLVEKLKILTPFKFDKKVLESLCDLALEQIQNAHEAFKQYCENHEVTNPRGCLRNAILGQWKPNEKKIDKEELANKKAEEIKSILKENIFLANQVISLYAEFFNQNYGADFGDKVIHLRYKDSRFPLSLLEEGCVDTLGYYLETNKPK